MFCHYCNTNIHLIAIFILLYLCHSLFSFEFNDIQIPNYTYIFIYVVVKIANIHLPTILSKSDFQSEHRYVAPLPFSVKKLLEVKVL